MRRSTFLFVLVTGAVKSTYALAFGGSKPPAAGAKTDCGCVECRCPDCDGRTCTRDPGECGECGSANSANASQPASCSQPACCRADGQTSRADSTIACRCEACECPQCDGQACSCESCDCAGCAA
jgi:hypothetical protein